MDLLPSNDSTERQKQSRDTTLAGASDSSKVTRKQPKARPARALETTRPSNARGSGTETKPKNENIAKASNTNEAPSTANPQLQNSDRPGVEIFKTNSNMNQSNAGNLSTTAVPSATTEHTSQPASHKKELEEMGISIQEHLAENNANLAKTATTTVSSKSAAVAASPQSQAAIDTQQTLVEKDKAQTSGTTAAVTAQTSSRPLTSTETSNNDPSNTPAHANQLSELGIETDVDAVDMAAATHNDSSSGEFLEF